MPNSAPSESVLVLGEVIISPPILNAQSSMSMPMSPDHASGAGLNTACAGGQVRNGREQSTPSLGDVAIRILSCLQARWLRHHKGLQVSLVIYAAR